MFLFLSNIQMDLCIRRKAEYLVLWLLSQGLFPVYCQFQTQPSNDYAKVGQSVTLLCTVNDAGEIGKPQAWKEYISSEAGSLISQNDVIQIDYNNSYQIKNVFNLHIPNVTLSHGGKYGCSDSSNNEIFVQLIVLESDTVLQTIPLTNPIIEGSTVRYSCAISYRGHWAPHIYWTGSKTSPTSQSDESSGSYVIAYIDVQTSKFNNGEEFSCITSFGSNLNPLPGENDAKNIPAYYYTGNSSVLQVYYAPTNVSIVNQVGLVVTNLTYTEDEELSCLSESNPPPVTIQWVHVEEGIILNDGQHLNVTDSTATGHSMYTIQCTVLNILHDSLNIVGYKSAEIAVYVPRTSISLSTPKSTEETSTVPTSSCTTVAQTDMNSDYNTDKNNGSLIAVIVLGVLCVCLLIVCSILAFKLRQNSEDTKMSKEKSKKSDIKELHNVPSVYFESTDNSTKDHSDNEHDRTQYLMPVSKPDMVDGFGQPSEQSRPLPTVPDAEYDELKEATAYMEPYKQPEHKYDVLQTTDIKDTATNPVYNLQQEGP